MCLIATLIKNRAPYLIAMEIIIIMNSVSAIAACKLIQEVYYCIDYTFADRLTIEPHLLYVTA